MADVCYVWPAHATENMAIIEYSHPYVAYLGWNLWVSVFFCLVRHYHPGATSLCLLRAVAELQDALSTLTALMTRHLQ